MMQKEEVTRILKLVKEGKLSPEEAAELMEAIESPDEPTETVNEGAPNGATPPPPPGDAPKAGATQDPLRSFLETMEQIGRDVAKGINWDDVSKKVKTNIEKGSEVLKQAAEEVKAGKFTFNFGMAQETRTVELGFSIPENGSLKIESPAGDIRVIGGAAENKLIAKAMFRSNDLEEAKARAEGFTPVIEEGPGFVQVRQPAASGLTVDLEFHLATTAQIDVRGQSGDVDISKVSGSVRVVTNSGDIAVRDASGSVEITTSHGDIRVEDVNASWVAVEDKSGSLSLKRVHGDLNLRTGSGDILLEDCSGKSISVEAVSGDITMGLSKPLTGSVTVRAVQGDTSLSIPDGSHVRVTMSTLKGTVDCTADLTDSTRSERRITGQLGDGQGVMDISAVAGDIKLRQTIPTASEVS